MANTVLLKRKTNGSGSPDADDLAAGELAINTVDKKLFFEDSSGNIQEIKDSTTLAAEVQADTVALAIALG
tara:strand:- start:3507 stop:3719 length:213 start_codon:yes stop_codon:yes gene_type:complete